MLFGCHLPPCAAGICRSFNSRAIALKEIRPFAWSARIVEASAFARVSAAFLCACPLLTLPLVIRPRRVSILPTEVRCQLPPRAVGTPLRFNSPASARRETKPAAMSFRMVEAKAWARDPAACLSANAPCPPRLRKEVPAVISCFIGTSWSDLDGSARQRRATRLG